MIERFIEVRPTLFTEVSRETLSIAKGHKRNYFGRSPKRMFPSSPHLADDANNYVKLTNGWYANTNLSNREKFDVLCRFAAMARLVHGVDWLWEVDEPSDGLKEKLERKAIADRMVAEIEKEIDQLGKPEN